MFIANHPLFGHFDYRDFSDFSDDPLLYDWNYFYFCDFLCFCDYWEQSTSSFF